MTSAYVSEWTKIKSEVAKPDGRWCCEFFNRWAVLIEGHTGVKIHDDNDGLTRIERYSLADTCAIRIKMGIPPR